MGYTEKISALINEIRNLLQRSNGELQPRNILSKINSELERCKKLGIDENAFVPNEYSVYLNSQDYEELSPLLSGIEEQIKNKLMEKVKNKGYKLLSSTISLEIRDDDALEKNEVVVNASFLKERSSAHESHAVKRELKRDGPSQESKTETMEEGILIQGSNDNAILLPHATKIVEDKKTRIVDNTKVTMEVIEGENKGDVISLRDGEYTFGRGNDAVILIRDSDDTISRMHFKITVKEGKVSIKDLNSSNGTKLNNEKIEDAELNQGDKIEAGRAVLRVV